MRTNRWTDSHNGMKMPFSCIYSNMQKASTKNIEDTKFHLMVPHLHEPPLMASILHEPHPMVLHFTRVPHCSTHFTRTHREEETAAGCRLSFRTELPSPSFHNLHPTKKGKLCCKSAKLFRDTVHFPPSCPARTP